MNPFKKRALRKEMPVMITMLALARVNDINPKQLARAIGEEKKNQKYLVDITAELLTLVDEE